VTSPDPRERFSATASLYARHRPSYPSELFEWIAAATGTLPGAPVVDLGCGTGISTRLLAARGYQAIGIDPNEAMLAEARLAGGGPLYRRGEAAATGLPDSSADLVTVAQAFHWFEIPATMRELRRVLRPGRFAVAYWNVRELSSDFMGEYDGALRRFSREYSLLDKPRDSTAAIKDAAGVRDVREAEFRFDQEFDLEGLLGRAYSSSYVIHGVDDHAGFREALAALHERHGRGGLVTFRYRTVAIAWRPGSS
jgi:SAM-dependent methyltransferase